MSKAKNNFICLSCQNETSKWSGKCSACGEWNTIVEQDTDLTRGSVADATPSELFSLKTLPKQQVKRIRTNSAEFDRVLGGSDPGIVVGSVLLLAGNPGVGKSTLLLQVASSIEDALYFSAEESLEQLRLRANRLGLEKNDLRISAERKLPNILRTVSETKPRFVVIDSIQTVYDDSLPGTPGSLTQVRENCWRIQQFAKELGVAILVVGHVTKEGVIAGPKVLEHLVDVVMYLEGDRRNDLRLLRCDKNRFGSTEEVGIWHLTSAGFETVDDPGKLFAQIITSDVPGRALTVTVEGSRAFLVEIQALVTKTAFGYPKRTAQGIDLGRLNLLLAVLENRIGLPTSQYDVYVNVVGGFNLRDPGIDLAVAGAIASGITRKILPDKEVLVGEVGLLGEVRPAIDQARRKKEADRLGYHLDSTSKSIKSLSTLLKSSSSNQ